MCGQVKNPRGTAGGHEVFGDFAVEICRHVEKLRNAHRLAPCFGECRKLRAGTLETAFDLRASRIIYLRLLHVRRGPDFYGKIIARIARYDCGARRCTSSAIMAQKIPRGGQIAELPIVDQQPVFIRWQDLKGQETQNAIWRQNQPAAIAYSRTDRIENCLAQLFCNLIILGTKARLPSPSSLPCHRWSLKSGCQTVALTQTA